MVWSLLTVARMNARPWFVLLASAWSALFFACSGDPERCADGSRIHAGSIEITYHEGSARLADLECVQVVTGSITISDRDLSAPSLEPLRDLVHVFGDVTIQGARLRSLRGLEQLTTIGGSLRLIELEEIESLDGLENLRELEGDLELRDLPRLRSIEALGSLDGIGGSLSLERLPVLETLKGLGAVARIGGELRIDSNDALTSLDGLRSLGFVGGTFSLTYNPALISATIREKGLLDYPIVGGDVFVYRNDALEHLTGFGVPNAADEPCDLMRGVSPGFPSIIVHGNASLKAVELPRTRNVSIFVTDNEQLTTVSGDSGGNACLFELKLLPRLTTLDLLAWNVDGLAISKTGIVTLDGLEVTSVDCSLEIFENDALEDVSALSSGISSVAFRFQIYENPSLAACDVQAIVDDLPDISRLCLLDGKVYAKPRSVFIDGNDESAVCK